MVWNAEYDKVPGYAQAATADGVNTTGIVRLVADPTVKRDVRFDELSFSAPDSDSTQFGSDEKTAGFVFPVVRVNDYVFSADEIRQMTISCEGMVPTISLTVSPSTSRFADMNMPKDGDMVSTFIRSNVAGLQYLRDDFVITQCSYSARTDDEVRRIRIDGKLFIHDFDSGYRSFGFIGTSKSVLRQVAEKYGLGFATNDFSDTNDLQAWIATDGPEPFIRTVTMHAWKDERSFFGSWVDLYYNLCFVNVNKFLLSGENPEDQIDVTYLTQAAESMRLAKGSDKPDDAPLTLKVLSNSSVVKGSPFFIKKWSPVNVSSEVSIENGYSKESYSFLHNQNLYAQGGDGCFEVLVNRPAYDQSKLDTHILLRGRARYEKGKNPESDSEKANWDFIHTYVTKDWQGVQYVKSDSETGTDSNNGWSGNVHRNYMRAETHNEINIAELDKLYIDITCDGLCLQVMRGERVPVFLVYNTQMDKENNMINNPENQTDLNKFYSGYYVVDGIEYSYKPNDGLLSGFETRMTLKRREWPTPVETKSDAQPKAPDAKPKEAPDEKEAAAAAKEAVPTQTAAAATDSGRYSNLVVILDPGHGSTTKGKRSPDGRLLEYSNNRELVSSIEAALDEYGIKHYRTVESDEDTGLSKRANRGISLLAQAKKANPDSKGLFLSVHSDAGGSGGWTSARGWSAWTTKGQAQSDKLAECLYEAAKDVIGPDGVKLRKDETDGDADNESDFTVIYKSQAPAVLTENLFHDNMNDAAMLMSADFRKKVGELHAKGVVAYAQKYFKM